MKQVIAVLLGAALLAAGCTLPGQVEGPVELTAVFSDVGDLVAGHSVQVADVRVGSVTGIELTEDYQAKVTLKIKDGLHLPVASEAVLRTTSLLGEKFIELRAPKAADGSPARSDDELLDGDVIEHTAQAPELEFVAEEAVQVLAGVAGNDIAAIVQTGGIGFGGRATELGSLIDDLSTVTGTLAGQTNDIVAIIDGLDRATSTLAADDGSVDALLVNLADTTEALADNRELTLQTLRDLTRLAKAQNDEVFGPYRAKIEGQIKQLDAILALVVQRREEVGVLVDWLAEFVHRLPLGAPGDFAQIYGWFQLGPVSVAPVNRRVLINLVVFAGVFALMLFWAVNNIVTIDRIERPYTITGDFDQAAGVRSNAEVTFLGVHYGRVSGVARREGGVHITMKIDRGKDIPLGSIARIFRKSAIGEPYVDFVPPSGDDAPKGKVEPGDNIEEDHTTVPLEFSELLRSASALIGSIDPKAAGSLVHELALGLDGRGQDLRDLTTGFDAITATFAARTDALDRLAENNTRIVKVLADHRLSIGQSISNLRSVAEGLRDSKGDLQSLLRDGPAFLTMTADLVAEQKTNLDCLLTDLAPVLHLAGSTHLDGLATLLQHGPIGFGYVFSSVDREADGPWVRVNLALPVGGTEPKQYTPRATLPVVPTISPCASTMRPASVFPTRSVESGGVDSAAAIPKAVSVGRANPFTPRNAAEVLDQPADVTGAGAPGAAVLALVALAGAACVLGTRRPTRSR